jgi:ABC-type glycerol-3-phosphate transport system permease component
MKKSRIDSEFYRKVCIYLILVFYCLFVIVPILWVLVTSLQPGGMLRFEFIPKKVTLENYQYIFTNSLILRSLGNSLIVSILSMVLSVVVSAMAGYAFSRYRFKGRAILMSVVLGLFMIPIIVNIIPLYSFLQRLGWLNTYQGLIIPYQALILPLNVFLMKNFFDTIPLSLEESALTDGCSKFGAFLRVTLPLSWPGVAVASMFAFRFSWNEFIFAITFISGRKMRTFQAALYWFLGLEKANWGHLTAAVIVGMIPVVIMFLIFQRQFIEGLTVGGVKG